MAFILQDGAVTLFFATEPKKFEKGPDISGTLKVNNKELRVGIWNRDGELKGKLTVEAGIGKNGRKAFREIGAIEISPSGEVNSARPSHTGTAEIGLDAFDIVLWTKVAKSGISFLSGMIKKPEAAKVEVVAGVAKAPDPTPFG